MNLRKNNAITLVVLIITVILMLILVGVAISQINGNGMINKTSKIKIGNNKKQLEERLEIAKQRAEAYDKPVIECLDKEGIEVEELGGDIIVAKINNDSFLVEDYNTVTYLENGFEVWGGISKDATVDEPKADVATSFDSGKGTIDDPYIIRTASQLAYLSKRVNEGESFEGKYFRQVAPICLGAKTSDKIWIPIGYAEETPFSGTYDGQNNKIIGLYSVTTVKMYDGSKKTLNYIGLFGVNTGNIKNLDMPGNYVEPSGIKGGMIVAYNKGGTIENCTNKSVCNASAYATVGAICGINENGTISNCHNEADLRGASGIAAVNSGMIEHCYNTGKISNWYVAYAGITGNNEGGTVEYCYNKGDIDGNGTIVRENSGIVRSCYNEGNTSGNSGILSKNNGLVEKCYNRGNVNGGYLSGGIVSGNTSIVKNCYNVGKVNGATYNKSSAIVGYAQTGNTIINCYSAGIIQNGESSQMMYLVFPTKTFVDTTLSELQSEAILTILNSEGENVWRIDPTKNNGMPILDWQ